MDGKALRLLADEQAGLFTRTQAIACGYSEFQIRHRIRKGEWKVVLGPALAEAGLQVNVRLRDRAAQLAVPGSVLAGVSAARRWGMPVPPLEPCLAVGRGRTTRVSGVRLLRSVLPDTDIELVDGLMITSPARTVVDCACLLEWDDAVRLLDRALQRRWIDVPALVARVQEMGGRPGVAQLNELVRVMGTGAASAAERRFVALLRDAGLTGWKANLPIHDHAGLVGVGDVVFERERVVVEVDGRAYHVSPETFQRDRSRQNRLITAGWTVLRFTWADLSQRPEQVVRTVTNCLAARASAGS